MTIPMRASVAALTLVLTPLARGAQSGATPPAELAARAGLYACTETRRTLVLSPRRMGEDWTLVLTDLGTGDVRALFPAAAEGQSGEFQAGELLARPEPVAYRIRFPEEGVLELHESATETRWRARRRPTRGVELTFEGEGARLEGTLHLPEGKGPFPAVVLAHGSEGGQDRHAFDALPYVLASRGLAVLAYDKRGCGRSSGSWDVAHDVLADDLIAGIALLRERAEIGERIGVIGFSEGAWIAPLAASRCPDIAFVVALCGGALPKSESFLHQAERRLVDQGLSGPALETALEEPRATLAQSRARIQAGRPTAFDLRQTHDPAPEWQEFRGPVLFLIGDSDVLVPPRRSAEQLRQVLSRARHPDFTIRLFPRAHHGMFLGETGSFQEFARMEVGAFVPGYWETLCLWLDERARS